MKAKAIKCAVISAVMIAMASAVTLNAQSAAQIQFPYRCSFEDPAENANWVLNSPNQTDMCHDRWYIGQATFTDGLNSLYISCDDGNTTNHGFTRNVVVAYREIEITQAGYYTFTFDWKNDADEGSGLYFCLIQKQKGAPQSIAGSATIPNDLYQSARPVTREDGTTTTCLRGTTTWEMARYSLQIQPQSLYVAFVWQNAKTDTTFSPLGACIDNFQIVSSKCSMPTELNIETGCDTVTLSWYGTSAEYSVEFKENGTQNWRKTDGITQRSYRIIGLAEGTYDFRVRGICNGTDTSAYMTKNGVPVFCAANHCIDYVHLDNKEVVTCYTGHAGSTGFVPCAPIDNGADNIKSRHTTYWVKNQYDPLTDYGLKTIPDGEFASVRLGNWNVNREAERIEYKYHVDSIDPGILILKYAVVLQDPEHPEREQPYFQLTLLNEKNQELDPTCGKAQFTADRDMEGWKTATPYSDKDNVVTYKDWTTLGINLDDYKGQTIKIRLTTQDCLQGAHFGYAYFTLGCSTGTIESVSCGAEEDQEIVAPLGFDYQWFKEYDADGNPAEVSSTEREFIVPRSDDDPYHCRCMFKENHGCYFDLHTIVSPRFPLADFVLEHCPENCENKYRLRNKSHVILDYGDSVVHTTDKVDTYYWYMEDGSVITDESPLFTAANEGDTVTVRLKVGIADDECTDEIEKQIIIPSIISEPVTIDTTICASDFPFYWESAVQWLGEAGTHYDMRKNYAGCDSITILNLHSTPEIEDTYVDTTICYGDSIVLTDTHGNMAVYSTTGEYTVSLLSEYRCDSVIILSLTVRDEVTFTTEKTDVKGAPNTGSITIKDAPEGYTYTLNGQPNARLTGLGGGTYEIVVIDSAGCMSDPVEVFIDQECIETDLDLSSALYACADDSVIVIPCGFTAGAPTTYRIEYGAAASDAGFTEYEDTFDVNEITIIVPDSCRPGHYDATAVIEDIICDEQRFPFEFDIYYAADIVVQKWNNVLAVKNEKYNGGYTFAAFQWYKDGAPLTGEIGSYYYAGEGETLDTATTYHVVLTRADDGTSIATCPVTPTVKSDISAYPQQTVVQAGAPLRVMNVKSAARVSLWSVSGVYCSSWDVDGHNSDITAPLTQGAYIMVIERNGERRQFKILVM